jgi:hypothetical protein
MDAWFDGFWQLLFDDPDEDIRPAGRTTMAVRRSGCRIYAGGHYMELLADKDRPLAEAYPPPTADAAQMLRTHRATGGRFTWKADGDSAIVDHVPLMAVNPRDMAPFQLTISRAANDDANATVAQALEHVLPEERWRRLSGRGHSPLAGVWWADGTDEQWMYVVCEGHYGVMRVETDAAAAGLDLAADLTTDDEQAAAFFAARSLNAGAHMLASRTFDHWPMFASTHGYAGKHPTFYLASLSADEMRLTFAKDNEAAEAWRRIG